MGHYAQVENGIVTQVIVAEQDFIDTLPDKELWYETSYNIRGGFYLDPITREPHEDQALATATAGRKRKNYASIGFTYNSEQDAFIPPIRYPSWVLNEDSCLWNPPIPYPIDSIKMGGNKRYEWNEPQQEFTYTGYKLINGELVQDE